MTESESRTTGEMTSKVIFLDFDGPVIPMRAWAWNRFLDKKRLEANKGEDSGRWIHLQKMDPCAVYMILDILDKTGAKLVISSSWRRLGRERINEVLGFNDIDPEAVLHEDWRTSVEQDEPDFLSAEGPSQYKGLTRSERIQNWINNHPEITHWCWLDDMNMDLPNGVRVCMWDGFMFTDYRKMLNKLDYSPLPPKLPKELEENERQSGQEATRNPLERDRQNG